MIEDQEGFKYDEKVNSFNQEELHKHFSYVFDTFATCLKASLGPGGASSIIVSATEKMPVLFTKDGASIMKEIRFGDQVDHFISVFLRDISETINKEIGDSTTSVLIIANAMYKAIVEYSLKERYGIDSIMPPISKRLILDEIRKVLSKELLDDKNCILTVDDLKDDPESLLKMFEEVAMCSSNNNKEISQNVISAYKKKLSNPTDVMISTTTAYGKETTVEEEVGFKFGNGFICKSMVNKEDGITCEFENPRFILIEGVLANNDIPGLNKLIDYVVNQINPGSKTPLVIIAKEYEAGVIQYLTQLTTNWVDDKGELHAKEPIAAMMMDTSNEMSYTRFEDLKILLDCHSISTKKGAIAEDFANTKWISNYIGKALSYKGFENTKCSIKLGDRMPEKIAARIKELEDLIYKIRDEYDEGAEDPIEVKARVAMIREQIAMIRSDMSVIRIGGTNKRDKENKSKIYEDVIAACYSASLHGFAIGGNVAIVHKITKKRNELIDAIYDGIMKQEVHVVVGNDKNTVRKIIGDFLDLVEYAFKAAYKAAIHNMVGSTKAYDEIVDNVYGGHNDVPTVYNLVKNEYFTLEDAKKGGMSPIAPANTDTELMRVVFENVGNIISCNQLLALIPGQAFTYMAQQQRSTSNSSKKVYNG
jgi:chaperonin GroEL